MPKLPSTLLALALASAFAAPTWAQQISTSQGLRTLTRTEGFSTEQQYAQAARTAEGVIIEILADIDAAEKARGGATGNAAAIQDQVKKVNADLAAQQSAFDAKDQKYRTDLAAFEQRQAQLNADVNTQRQQAAALEALPSAQRDNNEVQRLNTWAAQLGTTRNQIEADRARLLADHDAVEAERARLAQQRTDALAKLNGSRESTLGSFNQATTQRAAAYKNLGTAVTYLRQVRDAQAKLSKLPLARSEPLDTAMQKLSAYENGAPVH
jgi:chromosome segregation ATPase